MKKKIVFLLSACLLALLLTSCGEVLSVVTLDENGEKVVTNYISTIGDTVYDESISIKSWRELGFFDDADMNLDDLLFKIENKKENIVVLGNEESALEIKFFDGGCNVKIFASADSFSNAMNSFSNAFSGW